MKRSIYFYLFLLLLTIFVGLITIFSACTLNDEENAIYVQVIYSASEGGRIEGAANQEVKYGESASQVLAVAECGYYFSQWSDGVTTAARYEVNVMQNISVTAEFKKIVYEVQYIAGEGGTISGKISQSLEYGENAEAVTAVPKEGYYFVQWSDGRIEATRQDINIKQDIRIVADFKKQTFSVRFLSAAYGSIYYVKNNGEQIYYGESSSLVRAKPDNGYVFLYWSDGSTEVERQIEFVKDNIILTAYFGYSAEYCVNNNIGGKILGKTYQAVLPGDMFEEVVAVPDEGYVFAGWSDLELLSTRQDLSAERCWEYIAYFEPISKTFRYDYGIATGIPAVNMVTINRNKLSNVNFVVPKLSGYSFCGWYTDEEYNVKVANNNGRLMLGSYVVTLETDTLYAKWEKVGVEQPLTYKILHVIVDEVDATLYSSVVNEYVAIDYKMSALERNIFWLASEMLSEYLNDWFDGKINFEVDTYFTTTPVRTESFDFGMSYYGQRVYRVFADVIPELKELLGDYNSILTTEGINDYNELLHDCAGISKLKYGSIYIEECLRASIINYVPLQYYYSELNNRTNEMRCEEFIDTYIHEFIHTVEMYYARDEVYEFHSHLGYYMSKIRISSMAAMKLYLLYEGLIDGQKSGIPPTYWEEVVEGLPPTYLR